MITDKEALKAITASFAQPHALPRIAMRRHTPPQQQAGCFLDRPPAEFRIRVDLDDPVRFRQKSLVLFDADQYKGRFVRVTTPP
jgi:hypothetical protein